MSRKEGSFCIQGFIDLVFKSLVYISIAFTRIANVRAVSWATINAFYFLWLTDEKGLRPIHCIFIPRLTDRLLCVLSCYRV